MKKIVEGYMTRSRWQKFLKIKEGESKCVYCGRPISWELTCEPCGYREDKALGKVD